MELESRAAPIENKLKGCKKCRRAVDHEPNMFGMWECIVCGGTRN